MPDEERQWIDEDDDPEGDQIAMGQALRDMVNELGYTVEEAQRAYGLTDDAMRAFGFTVQSSATLSPGDVLKATKKALDKR